MPEGEMPERPGYRGWRQGDLDRLIADVTSRRTSRRIGTVIGPPIETDLDDILRLAAHVGPVDDGFRRLAGDIVSGKDPRSAGYGYALTVIRPSPEEPIEGYNLTRVRYEGYGGEGGEMVAASLSTSFGGGSGGASVILFKHVVDTLARRGVSKFWSRPNRPMRGVLDRLGFAEAGLPAEFLESERKGGHTICSRNMEPVEVAYEYYRATLVGETKIGVAGTQLKLEGNAELLDGWVRFRGLRVSENDAKTWLQRIAPPGSRVRASPDMCGHLSIPVYFDALAEGAERRVRWVSRAAGDESETFEYHPIVDLPLCFSHYLAKGGEFRAQARAAEEPRRVYDFIRTRIFSGKEF